MTEEKIKEIKKMLRQGVPGGGIRETLTEEGYTKDETISISCIIYVQIVN